ncbi:MAG: heat repeat-containing PBS lyase [uncultured bacterium]|nr:MAG: heat repeat-containing PBS lyase [uncultured bacterium]
MLFTESLVFAAPHSEKISNLQPKSIFSLDLKNDKIETGMGTIVKNEPGLTRKAAISLLSIIKKITFPKIKRKQKEQILLFSLLFMFAVPQMVFSQNALQDTLNNPVQKMFEISEDINLKRTEWLISQIDSCNDNEVLYGIIAELISIAPKSKIESVNEKLLHLMNNHSLDDKIKICILEMFGKYKYEKALSLISDKFTDSNPLIREKSAEAMVNIGEASNQYLLKHFKDKKWFIQKLVIETIGKLGNKENILHIVEFLENENFEVRKATAKALENLNFIPVSDNEKVFYYIAKAEWEKIVALGVPAITPLKKAWDIKYWKIYEGNKRASIIKTSGIISASDSFQLLTEALFDTDPEVVNASESALLNNSEKILTQLHDYVYQEKELEKRLKILEIIKKINSEKSEDFYIKVINDDFDYKIKLSCAESLLKTKPESVIPLLEEIINSNWTNSDNRLLAFKLSGEIGLKAKHFSPKIIPYLKQDSTKNDKITALLTLGKIGYTEAIPAIKPLLKDSDSSIRKTAGDTLNLLGYLPETNEEKMILFAAMKDFSSLIPYEAEAVDLLQSMLGDKDKEVDTLASETLVEIIKKTNDIKIIEKCFNIRSHNVNVEAIKRAGEIGDINTAKILKPFFINEIIFDEIERQAAFEAFNKIKNRTDEKLWTSIFETKSLDKGKIILTFLTSILTVTGIIYIFSFLAGYFISSVSKIKELIADKNIKKSILPFYKTIKVLLPSIELAKTDINKTKDIINKLTLDFIESGEIYLLLHSLPNAVGVMWTLLLIYGSKFCGGVVIISILLYVVLVIVKMAILLTEKETIVNYLFKYEHFSFPVKIAYNLLLLLITFNFITSWLPAILGFSLFISIYSFIHYSPGVLAVAKTTDIIKTTAYFIRRFFSNPIKYVVLSLQYAKMEVVNPEQFYFLKNSGEKNGNELFNSLKNSIKKFKDEENEHLILQNITKTAFYKSEKWDERYVVLKGQTPIAFMLSENYKDFMFYLQSDELYEIVKLFKTDTIINLFKDLIKTTGKHFPVEDQKEAFDIIIRNTYEILKNNGDVRNYLEIQISVALEMSKNLNDFKFHIGIIKSILSGKYDIKLVEDKARFKAFFEKVGSELRFADQAVFFETMGLIELRVKQQGFNVEHFYDEVFKTFSRETLEGSIDIIFEIVKNCRLFPTEKLINIAKETKDRTALYKAWNNEVKVIREGRFDINNPLHVEFEYSSFRRIIDNSRIVSNQFKNYSYANYINYALRKSDKITLDEKHKAELVYAGYEASLLGKFIEEVKAKAESYGREVWLIPNLSYGRFASIFIDGNLRMDDIEIILAKVGSSDTHENPFYINPTFIKGQVLERMVKEKPVIVVVDGSFHLERYPDAHQGYLNLAIALNDVISNGDIEQYAEKVGRSADFIREIKEKNDFKAICKIIKKSYEKISKKDKALFNFHFWNPRGKELSIRSSWQTRRGSVGHPKPVSIENINGPAFIFVNSVLTDKEIPQYVKDKAKGISHNPAYYDDVDDLKITNLLFKFDDFGLHLSDILHELEMHAANGFVQRVKEGEVYKPTTMQSIDSDDISTLASLENELHDNAKNVIKIKRLIDELDSDNSKIRADAAASLAEFTGNQTVAAALIKAILNEKDEEAKYWIITAIGAIGVKETIVDISKMILDEENINVVKEMVRAIKKLADVRGINSLSKLYYKFNKQSESNIDIRREIMLAFRSINSKEVLPDLLSVLQNDKSEIVRATAGEAYLDVGREDAILNALTCLDDKSPSVREILIEGLGDLAPKNQFGAFEPNVLEKLYYILLSDPDLEVRYRTAWALGQIENADTIEVLKYAAKLPENKEIIEIIHSSIAMLEQISTNSVSPEKTVVSSQLPLKGEEPTIEKSTVITFQGKEIDVSKIKACVLDLDGTVAELSQPLTPKINEQIIGLLQAGIHVVINTGEVEENMEQRVYSLIPKNLRKNLHFYTDAGSVAFGFNENGEKTYYFKNIQDENYLKTIQNEILDNKIVSEKDFLITDYFLKINLTDKNKKERKKIAQKVNKILSAKNIDFRLWLQSRSIYINNFDKVDATKDFMSRFNIPEENLLIAGDRARSYGLDRRLLTSFQKAVSINFGETSPTIADSNSSIIQSNIKNVLGVAVLFDKIVDVISPQKKHVFPESSGISFFHPVIGTSRSNALSNEELQNQISSLLFEKKMITALNDDELNRLFKLIAIKAQNNLNQSLVLFKNFISEEINDVNILVNKLVEFLRISNLDENTVLNPLFEKILIEKISLLYKESLLDIDDLSRKKKEIIETAIAA